MKKGFANFEAWYWRKKRAREFLSLLLSAVLVVATGFVSLCIEDWFPPPASGGGVHPLNTTWCRFGLALVFILSLAVLAWFLGRGRRNNGTLYYYRILHERAPDIHRSAHDSAKERFLDYRAVTRILSLGSDRSVDVSHTVRESLTQLESAVNTDDDTTSHELAPNAHWPIAFALGFEWPLPDSAILVEFDEGSVDEAFRVSAHVAPATVDPSDYPGIVDEDATLVHVYVHYTRTRPLAAEAHQANIKHVFNRFADVTMQYGFDPADHAKPKLQDQDAADDGALIQRVHVGESPENELSASDAAAATATAILTALHLYPNAHVAVTARLPKVVAVLAGRQFAAHLQSKLPEQPKGLAGQQNGESVPRLLEDWNDPWQRLSFLNYNDSSKQMQAMRVREAQQASLPFFAPPPVDRVDVLNVRTPHPLIVYQGDTVIFRRDPSGPPARLREISGPCHALDIGSIAVPLIDVRYAEEVSDLPAPEPGTLFVVSRVTAQALPARSDLIFPVDEVRDESKRIIGCRALGRFTQ